MAEYAQFAKLNIQMFLGRHPPDRHTWSSDLRASFSARRRQKFMLLYVLGYLWKNYTGPLNDGTGGDGDTSHRLEKQITDKCIAKINALELFFIYCTLIF